MWTISDLHEGDYIICKNENDRTKMHLELRRHDIWSTSDTKLIGGNYRPVLRVMQIPYHKGYESEEFRYEG